MLRASLRTSVRALHTSTVLGAAKASGPKASAQGFKRGGDSGKTGRKSAGSFRFFEDHVHAGRYGKTSNAELNVGPFSGELEVGTVARYTENQKKRLTQCGAFKKDQFHEVFPTPVTLVREETKTMEEIVKSASVTPSKSNRLCIIGERGIGKSTLLAQTLALAVENKDAVVIPVPHALRLVDGSNDYWLDAKLQTYIQPMYTKSLLDKIRHVNEVSLKKIALSKEYTIDSITKGRSATKFNTQHNLLDLVKANVTGRLRGQVLQILIDELLLQDQAPVYLTIDNFSALTASPKTAYKNAQNQALKLEELQITKLILDLASGAKSFKKGAVILSTSGDDRETQTLSAGLGLSQPNAYAREYNYNKPLSSQLAGVQALELSKLSKENVGSLVNVLAQAGAFRSDELAQKTMEQLTAQKYVLSGNGNPLELIKSVVMYL